MESLAYVGPPKKKIRTDLNFAYCIVCQEKDGELVANPEPTSYSTIIDYIEKLAQYKSDPYPACHARLNGISVEALQSQKASWHRHCYSKTCHKKDLNSAKTRYEKSSLQGKDPNSSKLRGRPTRLDEICSADYYDHPEPHFTRSSSATVFSSAVCIFCELGPEAGMLHEVRSFDRGQRLRKAADVSGSSALMVKVNSAIDPNDARSIDVHYHENCWQKNVDKVLTKHENMLEIAFEKEQRKRQAFADMEFFHMVNSTLQTGQVLDMAKVQNAYIRISEENNVSSPDIHRGTLKKRLEETIPNIQFGKPSNKRETERVFLQQTAAAAINQAVDSPDVAKEMFNSALTLRNLLSEAVKKKWEFSGSLQGTDGHVHPDLYAYIRWAIIGPVSSVEGQTRNERIHRDIITLADTFLNAYKSSRQVAYTPTSDISPFRSQREWPLQFGIAAAVHHTTRSENLLNLLHGFRLSVSYSRILQAETQLASAVVKATTADGIYVPPELVIGRTIFFAIDNSDFNEDTPDGKRTTHATATAIFQRQYDTDKKPTIIPEVTSQRSFQDPVKPKFLECHMPAHVKPKAPTYESFSTSDNKKLLLAEKVNDMVWLLSKTVTTGEEKNNKIPTWSAYNSLLSNSQPLTRVCVLPLVQASPTLWPVLLTVLKQAQGINTIVVGPGRKTIISLDMQLYEKAKQLEMTREDFKGKFIFRIGELHTVMTALRAAGNMLEYSGIDDIWVEAELYGPTTARQIMECGHVKRAITAHLLTLQALFTLYQHAFFLQYPELQQECINLCSDLNLACETVSETEIREKHSAVVEEYNRKLLQCLDEFDLQNKTNPMFQVFLIYMELILGILSFIKATRLGDWDLHLESLSNLTKYFFAFDKLHYARMVPEYLAEMQDLKKTDPEVLKEFQEGNFVVNKNKVSFCAIGADHGIEHENRWMKVMGGLVGITLNEGARSRLFYTAPIMARLTEETFRMAQSGKHNRSQHHELSKTLQERLQKKAEALADTIRSFTDPFSAENDDLTTIVTNTVIPEEIAQDLLNVTTKGQDAYERFVEKRIKTNEENLWAPMKKLKINTWKNAVKKVKQKIDNKVVELQDERAYFCRCIVVSRVREEVDIKDILGRYEFTQLPKSLFGSDGKLLPCRDKHKLMHALEELPHETLQNAEPPLNIHNLRNGFSCKVIDGLALMREMGKPDFVRNCKDFGKYFCIKLAQELESYDEGHLVLDRYDLPVSLKDNTREDRLGSAKAIPYNVTDKTPMWKVSLKSFLAHKKTKDKITVYLAQKVVEHFRSSSKRIIVAYRDVAISNGLDVEHLMSTQEEADTKIILHARDAAVRGATVLDIQSPDTDVLLLSIRRFPLLPLSTQFLTGTGSCRRAIALKPIYEHLDSIEAEALPGFHAFSGADQTGRFAGKGKLTNWNVFRKSSGQVKQAFANLGKDEEPSQEDLDSIEQYVCELYDPGTKLTTIAEVRWELFCKSQKDSDRLPPTRGALLQMIRRAHFQAMVWQSDIIARPELPPPEQYGWKLDGNVFIPIASLEPTTPQSIIELIRCKCEKSQCKGKCSCKQHKMPCTELCKCGAKEDSCLNTAFVLSMVDTDGDEEDFYDLM